MRLIKIFIIIFSISFTTKIFAQDTYQIVNANKFMELVYSSDNKILIDAQPIKEFNRYHIEDAINLATKADLQQYTDSINHDTPIFVYCLTDVRSKTVSEILYKKGFKYIYVLKGGLTSWMDEGLPIISKNK